LNHHPGPLRLAFAGTPDFAVPALEALAGAGHDIRAVYTQPDRPAGRGRTLHPGPVKRRAMDLGLAVRQPVNFKAEETHSALRELQVDALIVVAYGLILPANVLNIPRLGSFNIHASLLPRWRGAAPIQRALLAGDALTGISIMRMEAGLDTGPVLAVQSIKIGERETGRTLHDRLALLGSELIVATLADLSAGRERESPQPVAGVTYAHKIDKAEAEIDWSGDAEGIVRKVRAFDSWPVAQTHWQGAQLRIWEAELPAGVGVDDAVTTPGTVVGASAAGIDVICGRGILRITRLQLAGRKPLAAQEFLKAQPLAGARFGSHR
jgi:methionyl-tRNA formyltransferase